MYQAYADRVIKSVTDAIQARANNVGTPFQWRKPVDAQALEFAQAIQRQTMVLPRPCTLKHNEDRAYLTSLLSNLRTLGNVIGYTGN